MSGALTFDPLAAGPPGRYGDDLVEVRREDPRAMDGVCPIVETAHFRLRRRDRRIEVTHRLSPAELDNDLTGLLADELFTPGWLSGAAVFERVFTGVVLSTVDEPGRAWLTFYDNTLRRFRRRPAGSSTIASFAPVYERVLRLTGTGPVLDLGSCFGFLALLLAERGQTVTASDLSPGAMRLLGMVAARRNTPVRTLVCDAARVPLPDNAADTVTALHLLEHLSPDEGTAVVAEALRLARRRVIVAVPYEDEPAQLYGHTRTFGPAELAELGAATGRPFTVDEHHGGWLVLDHGERSDHP
ncbi:class I SAM-dependent methyltransferase [Amycolatopsis rhizosphaerae]|uniref:Class I SAM-dependent methyltransferase n=1 Tax=Amycolatopsis rhizosphaerae TaxID=2053003 RepID=A0A558DJP6_9PSEU|nr:mycofactocin oligosaccharide methyltransferase MftM [Amycolatopsis rhizosphaerae]TVT61203.1 class I SAM-dependent methyltransferase [Amycolatopsis rhizosphaerae]